MLRRTPVALRAKKAKSDGVTKSVRGNLKFMEANLLMSRADLKVRYREMAMRYHPDMNDGDDKMMKDLNKAYAGVLAFLDERDASGSSPTTADTSRSGEERESKGQELRLVDKIAKWMRADSHQQYEDPSVRDFREFTRGAGGEAKAFGTVLGTEEDEMRWAEKFCEERDESLGRKSQGRAGATAEEKRWFNPFDPRSPAHLRHRLDTMTVGSEPRLYSKLPQPAPRTPGLLAGGGQKENPHVAKRRDRDINFFHRVVAPEYFASEEWQEKLQRKANYQRKMRRLQAGVASGDMASLNMLNKALDFVGPQALKQKALPQSSSTEVNAAGYRAPREIRRAGTHISVKTRGASGDARVTTMSKAEFLSKGSYIDT
eukprot:TRINITY_DN11245_c0_g1_i1.p1 TRINITY_DN11245_c0_g1~~TRINITY_DN11245_c0_g1_i1.p1  ORF type:complete len:373 (+),score=60.12 TRINITY_DN11245_c0_g1_i1:161-1279(+)